LNYSPQISKKNENNMDIFVKAAKNISKDSNEISVFKYLEEQLK